MNKEKFMGMSGLIAAGIGSVCCVGPVVLAGLGLGAGALAFARSFGFLHMPMMALAVVLLGTAFFFHFKKKPSGSETGCCETQPAKGSKARIFLWTATGLTIFLFLFPYFI